MAGAQYYEVLPTLQPVDTWLPMAAKEQVNRESLRPLVTSTEIQGASPPVHPVDF